MLFLALCNRCGYFPTYKNGTIQTKSKDFAIKMGNHDYINKRESLKSKKNTPQYYGEESSSKTVHGSQAKSSIVEAEDRPECSPDSKDTMN